MKWFLPLVLSGCTVTASLVDPDTLPESDLETTDTEAGDDVDDPNNSDTDETESDDEVDPADFLVWRGWRAFDWEYGCYDEVDEVGVNVTEEREWEEYVEACDDCVAVFSLSASPDTICDGYVGINTNPVRGIVVDDDEVTIYNISDSTGAIEAEKLATGELDGIELTYEYDSDYYGYEYTVEGVVEFE